MKNLTNIICDRCGKIIEGEHYNVTIEPLSYIQRWEEEELCHSCLIADPKYHSIYNIGNE